MSMIKTGLGSLGRIVAGVFTAGLLVAAAPAFAVDDDPPKIDCTKAKNKNKPACKPHHTDDREIINGAYWLAHTGKLKESLALLATAQNRENPRYLNAMGFATRKLGDVDGALPYYARALEIEPDYVQAREYLGEAFLAKGDVAHASEQLAEIERRCGSDCVSFAALQQEIAKFEAVRASRS
jgi:tetratricopeptide (TPR) repeat protein